MQMNREIIDEKSSPAKSGQVVVHLHMTRSVYVLLVLLLTGPWVAIGAAWIAMRVVQQVETTHLMHQAAASGRFARSRPGPWGVLESTRIAIEPPEEFTYIEPLYQTPPKWVFSGYNKVQLVSFLSSAGLSRSQVSELAERTTYDPATNTSVVTPTPEFILEMPAEARARIYGALTASPDNGLQRFPFTLWPQHIEERFEDSGLPSEIIGDIRRMLYPYEKILLFADINVLMARPLPADVKSRLVKALARKNTMLVELVLNEDSNIEKLADYWGGGQRTKDLKPLLASLRRVPGGARIDIAHLLPQFARRRIYTYPWTTTAAIDQRRDCHWTAMNFFNTEPDDRFADPEAAKREVSAKYFQIIKPTKMGDLALLMTSKAEVLHSSVFVADDIVFTKNGAIPTEPWRFMKIDDMRSYFSVFYQTEGALNVVYFRKKGE